MIYCKIEHTAVLALPLKATIVFLQGRGKTHHNKQQIAPQGLIA